MPWCPKCKNEYREGITRCVDCGCELVDNEEEAEGTALIFGDETQMNALKSFLEYNNLQNVRLRFDAKEQVYELLVREEDREKAMRFTRVFLQQEIPAPDGPESAGARQEEAGNHTNGLYQNSAEKAEDNRSSAWTLLLVGGAGLLVMILGMAGLLPIHLTGTNKYMVYGIMSALFLLFLVMGVISMKNSRIFARKAESENSLRQTLVRWCEESLDPEEIDAELEMTSDTSEEIRYFKRSERLKEKLNHQFVNLDQAFLEHFIDEEYDSVFHRKEDV